MPPAKIKITIIVRNLFGFGKRFSFIRQSRVQPRYPKVLLFPPSSLWDWYLAHCSIEAPTYAQNLMFRIFDSEILSSHFLLCPRNQPKPLAFGFLLGLAH